MPFNFYSLVAILPLFMIASSYRRERSNHNNLVEEDPTDCLSLENVADQCMISASPGGCYIGDDVKDDEGAVVKWACWAQDETHTDAECQGKLKPDSEEKVGYKGACVYKGFGNPELDEDMQECTELSFHHTQCNPTTEMWGACYVKDAMTSEGWMCVGKDETGQIDKYRKGDCATTKASTGKGYDGACVFRERTQIYYQCESVPTVGQGRCSRSGVEGENKSFGACFTANGDTEWLCFDKAQLEFVDFKNCETTALPGKPTERYAGSCLFKEADKYGEAVKWTDPAAETPEPTPIPADTPKPTSDQSQTPEPTSEKSKAVTTQTGRRVVLFAICGITSAVAR